MLVLGGADGVSSCARPRGEIDALDLATRRWARAPTAGAAPAARSGLAAHLFEGAAAAALVVLGVESRGVFNTIDVVDLSARPVMLWSAVKPEWTGDWTLVPGCRLMAASARDTATAQLFVFGGQSSAADDDDESLHDSLIAIDLSQVVPPLGEVK